MLAGRATTTRPGGRRRVRTSRRTSVSGTSDAINAYKRHYGYAMRDLDRLMRFMDLGWVRHLPPAVALVLEGIDDMPRAVIDELVEAERGESVWEQEPGADEPRDLEFDLKVGHRAPAGHRPRAAGSSCRAGPGRGDRAPALVPGALRSRMQHPGRRRADEDGGCLPVPARPRRHRGVQDRQRGMGALPGHRT